MSETGSNINPRRTHFVFAVYVYLILFCLFIPVGFFPFQQEITDFVFKNLLVFLSETVFRLQLADPQISSDSTLLYILATLLLPVSVVVTLLLSFLSGKNIAKEKIIDLLFMLLLLHLSWSMFNYGANKIFKLQFYSPEPNILYTPFGKLDKDILYWSTIGTSYSYSLFLGLAEVIAGSLLLFKRLRRVGLLLCFFLSVNIFAINLCFDISVKLYSGFLLLASVVMILHEKGFLTGSQRCKLVNHSAPDWSFTKPYVKHFIHLAFVSLIFIIYFLPAIRSGYLNQDETPRHPLSGAYTVTNMITSDSTRMAQHIKNIFIHRQNFLIFQSDNDAMQDYKLLIDESEKKFILTDYDLRQTEFNYQYSAADSTLTLAHLKAGHEFTLVARALNWQKLPALQNSFHFTMDQP